MLSFKFLSQTTYTTDSQKTGWKKRKSKHARSNVVPFKQTCMKREWFGITKSWYNYHTFFSF